MLLQMGYENDFVKGYHGFISISMDCDAVTEVNPLQAPRDLPMSLGHPLQ